MVGLEGLGDLNNHLFKASPQSSSLKDREQGPKLCQDEVTGLGEAFPEHKRALKKKGVWEPVRWA